MVSVIFPLTAVWHKIQSLNNRERPSSHTLPIPASFFTYPSYPCIIFVHSFLSPSLSPPPSSPRPEGTHLSSSSGMTSLSSFFQMAFGSGSPPYLMSNLNSWLFLITMFLNSSLFLTYGFTVGGAKTRGKNGDAFQKEFVWMCRAVDCYIS